MPVTEAEIKDSFARLPHDKLDREYEREITAWVIQQARPEDFEALEAALKHLAAGPAFQDEPMPLSLRFDAFFALANLYRRYSKVHALENLIEAGRKIFDPYEPLVSHLAIMALNMKGDRKSCRKALEKATEILERWPHVKHAGLRHNYAETVAQCIDDGYQPWDETLLRKALQAVEEAIRDDPDYAKFHRTRGWLYFLLGDAEEGRLSYREAIEREDPRGRYYGIRLAEYRRELALRDAHLEVQELQHRASDILEKVSALQEDWQTRQLEAQTRQLEFLGFFTGILALILGGGGLLVTAQSDVTRFVLMLTLGGLLMLVFGSFNFMLHGKTRLERSLVPMMLGFLLLLASGLWLFWQS